MNIFTKVTFKTLRQNKTRTAVTIVGIILATAMLTAVTAFVSSLQHFMIGQVVENSGKWHGAMYGVSKETLDQILSDPEVSASGAYQEIGYARLSKAEQSRCPYLFVAGVEEELYDLLPVKLEAGRLPRDGSEIVLPRVLKTLGRIDTKIGDTLTLALGGRYYDGRQRGVAEPAVFMEDGETLAEELMIEETRTYTVVGISEQFYFDSFRGAAYCAFTVMDDEPTAKSSFSCYYTLKKPKNIYAFQNRMDGYAVAETHSELLRYKGVSGNSAFIRMLYGLSVILILLIMTGGVSLVYNSFAISVSDRTRQFGLLASVGATPGQMRGMVWKEACILSGVGIPLGILSGLLGIGVTLQVTGGIFSYYTESGGKLGLSPSLPAILIAALTALLTVLISAFIPAGRAAKKTPMDAIRQTADIRLSKRVRRSGKWSFRMFGLPGMIAGKHFARSRRQYRTTIFSLFVSVVLFISASSFSAYIKSSVTLVNAQPACDVAVYMDGDYEDTDKVIRAINETEGVSNIFKTRETYLPVSVNIEDVQEDYLKIINETGEEKVQGRIQLSGLFMVLEDDDYTAYLKEQGLLGKLNPERMEVAVTNRMSSYIPNEKRYRVYEVLKNADVTAGRTLTEYSAWEEAAKGAKQEEKEAMRGAYETSVDVTVKALVTELPMDLYKDSGGIFCILVSESMLENMLSLSEPYVGNYRVYFNTEDHREVAEKLENMAVEENWDSGIFVSDLTEAAQIQKNLLFTVDVFAYGFIILISLISAANVFNTISTGFLLRRREFAVLSSVGMSPKDLDRMLRLECLMYGAKALLYGIPVSVLITYCIYRVVLSSMDTGFYIPAASILVAVGSVFAVVLVTMVYARTKLGGENLMDSIRRESV